MTLKSNNKPARSIHIGRYVFIGALTIARLYGIGLIASVVIGKQLIDGIKRLLLTLSQPLVTGQRAVLISFPSSEIQEH